MLEVFHSIPSTHKHQETEAVLRVPPLQSARPACWLTLLDSSPPLAGPVRQLLGIGLLNAGTFLEAVNQVPTQPVPILNPLHRPSVVASLGHIGGRVLSGRSRLSSWADKPLPHRWQSQRERDSFRQSLATYLPETAPQGLPSSTLFWSHGVPAAQNGGRCGAVEAKLGSRKVRPAVWGLGKDLQ